MPKFSVIVPIYNVEKYLTRCIDSILNQTFKDFECILVDDGSPDRCPQICDEYARRDSRVKVIHKTNGGLSDARNSGLEIANGEYLYFLDSDDYVECTMMESLSNIISENNYDIISFNYAVEDESGKKYQRTKFPPKLYSINNEEDYINFVCNTFMPYKIGIEVWTKIFKRSIITHNGLRFYDNSKIFAEDICFSLCYFVNTNSILVIDDVLYTHIIRVDSITGKNNLTRIDEFTELNKIVNAYLKSTKSDIFAKKYYMIFYSVMNHRIRLSSYEDVLNSIVNIKDKRYFKKNAISIILHANKLAKRLKLNKNALILEYVKYLLYLRRSSIANRVMRKIGKLILGRD